LFKPGNDTVVLYIDFRLLLVVDRSPSIRHFLLDPQLAALSFIYPLSLAVYLNSRTEQLFLGPQREMKEILAIAAKKSALTLDPVVSFP